MPEIVQGVLATPGLVWIALTFLAAGLVRGFTGFGTALIVMPVAAAFLPMPLAIALVMFAGMFTWPLIVPRAVREADRREVLMLAGAAILTAPIGVWLLTLIEREVLRWAVSLAAGLTLAALVTGWRYHGKVRGVGLAGVGGAAGVLGGTTGLTGPPVILFYLASTRPAAIMRANTILFLALLDLGIVANMAVRGLIDWAVIPLTAALALPYGAGITVGQGLFRPDLEGLYRRIAYLVIAVAILTGLPLFD
jgi:hypothetical protein